MRKLTIYPDGNGTCVCEDLTVAGTLPVGRGRTPIDALINWLALEGTTVEAIGHNPHEVRVTT